MNKSTLFEPTLIRASAGSGKTYALSTRYLALLIRGEDPGHILATTFTRKAAGEIKERIFQRLAAAACSEEKALELGSATKVDNFSAKMAAETLERLVSQQFCMQICTLDSFFIQIARSFSLELGFGPSWSILDDSTTASLRSGAIRELCSGSDASELIETLRQFTARDASRSVHKKLEDAFVNLYGLFRNSDEDAWKWIVAPPPKRKEHIVEALDALSKCEVPKTKKGDPSKPWLKALASAKEKVEQGDWHAFLKTGLAPKILLQEKFYKLEVPQNIQSAYEPLIAQARSVLLARLASRMKATYELVSQFHHFFSNAKEASHAMQFNDVKRCLARAAILNDLEQVYYRLDARISHLLLDEFQDTSLEEWVVLQPIANEILSQADLEHTFFCVGDTKQAIYGWRGGVAEIFDSLQQTWSQLRAGELHKSYRSSPVILDFVNRIFSNLASNEALKDYQDVALNWQQNFVQHESALADLEGQIEVSVLPGKEIESHYAALAQRVSVLRKEYPRASIGVLLRKNKQVSEVLRELASQKYEVQASGEGGNPLTDSSAVLAFLSLFRLVDHPADSLAAFHVRSSPLDGPLRFSEQSTVQVLSSLKAQISHYGLGSVVKNLVHSVSSSYSEREQRRLQQLVDLAYEFEPSQEVRLASFVRRVESQKVEDLNSEQVRVMTVHQSKGLEFDIVVLFDNGDLLSKIQTGSFLTHREHALAPPNRIAPYSGSEIRSVSPEIAEMTRFTSATNVKEELAVLYVAMTRARQALFVLTQPPPERNPSPLSVSGILHTALLEPGSQYEGIVYKEGDLQQVSTKDESPLQVRLVPERISLADAGKKRQRGLPRQSPSERSHQETSLSSIMNLETELAFEYGTSIHALFEKITWLDEIEDYKYYFADFEQAQVQEVQKKLDQDQIRALLVRERYAADCIEVHNELPFAMMDADGVLSGYIDRLVICRDASGNAVLAEVIDYKTDKLGSDQDMLDRVELYREQLESYRMAASKIAQLPVEKVKCTLAFVNYNCCKEV